MGRKKCQGSPIPEKPNQEDVETTEVRRVGVIGSIEPFIEGSEPFENYFERLEAFFALNKLSDSEKVTSLTALIGPSLYKMLKNIVAPRKPLELSFEEVRSALRGYVCPSKFEIAESYKFHKRTQRNLESVQQYIVALKLCADSCNFKVFLDRALRDQLIVGLSDERIVKRLIGESSLTFQEACQIALNMEKETRELNGFQQSSKTSGSTQVSENGCFRVNSYQSTRRKGNSITLSKPAVPQGTAGSPHAVAVPAQCERCGRESHRSSSCPALHWSCFACGKQGHAARMCRSSTGISTNLQTHNFQTDTKQSTIKVYAKCLRPDIEYKTLGITYQTTCREMVSSLLNKYRMRHRDPKLFYLTMEVTVRKAGVRTLIVLDEESRPALLQSCHPRGDSRFALQMKNGGLVKIYDSVLMPGSKYKSLLISECTTVDELIQILLNCYNSKERIEQFSVYEVCESLEYQRKLHPDDCPLQVQKGWTRGLDFHFLLKRNPDCRLKRSKMQWTPDLPSLPCSSRQSIAQTETVSPFPDYQNYFYI